MYSDNSILNEVNIINKVICFIIILISLVLCSDPVFMLFVDIFLLLITREYKKIFKVTVACVFFNILSIFYSQFLWISKIFILIIYFILLKRVTEAIELRYVLEYTLYRFKSKKITYRILYGIYFIKYYRNNLVRLFLLKDDYGLKYDFNLIKFILVKSFYKTKIQLEELMEINKFRFYNYYKDRTYIEKITWESWDVNYIIYHIVILLLTVFYGR